MVSMQPTLNINGRYTAKEASEALGVHRNSLRNYEKAGLIRSGIHRSNGRKFYTGREIIRFWKSTI